MTLRPGSAAWLLRHELRLLWRRSPLPRRKLAAGLLVLAVAVVAHLIGLGVSVTLLAATAHPAERVAVANAVLLVLGGLMLSQALDLAVSALFERRDLDWLLASPVPLRRVLVTRMLGMAVAVVGPWLLMLGPVANVLAMLDGPRWLAAYPAFCALALLAAVAGAGAAVGLVWVGGLRRARQVVGTLGLALGAAVFLVSQSGAMLTPAQRAWMWGVLTPDCCAMPSGPAWWPARAVLGEALPLAAVTLLGMGALAAASAALARRFAAGAALDPPSSGSGTSRGAGHRVEARRFPASAFGALLRKEARMLRRTPRLLSRAAFQLVYAVPVTVTLLRDGKSVAALGLGSVTVFLAGESARLLISAAAGADEAAELAGTAPIPPRAAARAKVAAAGLGTGIIVALPLLGVAAVQPGLLPALLAAVAGTTGSGLLLGVWRPMAVLRRDLGAPGPSLGKTDWLGLFVSTCWSGAGALAMLGLVWAVVPAGVALAVLAAVRPRRSNPLPRAGGRAA